MIKNAVARCKGASVKPNTSHQSPSEMSPSEELTFSPEISLAAFGLTHGETFDESGEGVRPLNPSSSAQKSGKHFHPQREEYRNEVLATVSKGW